MSFVLAVFSIWVLGAAFMLMVERRAGSGHSVVEMAALPLFLGMGAVSLLMFLYFSLGIAFNFLNFVIVPAVIFMLMAARYASRPCRSAEIKPYRVPAGKWTRAHKFIMAAIAVQAAWVIFLAMSAPASSHDAVANYALKAKMFYFAEGIPAGFFAWPEGVVAHPDYPLLLPFVMTWIYAFTGFNDLIVKMLMPMVYLGFMALFFSRMRKLFDPAYALLSVFILATIPQIAAYGTVIHADLLLAAFVTCSMLYFISYARVRIAADLVFSSVLMGFSLWIKNEAIVFTAAFILLFVVLAARERGVWRKRALRDGVLAIAMIGAIALPWFLVKISSGAVNSDLNITALTADRLMRNVKDIPIILNLFQQEVFGPKKWNIFWVMFFASIIWKRKSLWRGENAYITLFLLVSAAGYFTGYMATTGENLFFYVNTTISRFMIHFAGVAAILMWALVYDDARETKSFFTSGGTAGK
jgi:hypothetical protein